MADKKITQLTALTGANTAADDPLVIVDLSANETKKIDTSELFKAVPAGTVGAPSIVAQGDQNTGIYFPAADTIAFVEGGVEAMRLDSAGNVGIGTTSPVNFAGYTTLELKGKSGGGGGLFRTSTSDGVVNFDISTASGGGASSAYIGTSSSHPIQFLTGGSERMRLDASGNLLVGVTSASYSSANRGVVNIGGSSGGLLSLISGTNKSYLLQSGADLLIENDTATGAMVFGTSSSTERMRIDSAGNLGLGVAPSASTLKTIQSQYGILSGNNSANILSNAYYNAGWNYTNTAPATLYEQNTGIHRWYNAPSGTAGTAITLTQAMTLNASGNLGIGTTSPSTKLHISSPDTTTGTGIASNNGIVLQNTNATVNNFTTIQNWDSTGGQNAQISFINVTQGSPFNGAIAFTTRSSVGNFAERMRIDSAGNVGIGTSSPTAKLDVNGAIYIRNTSVKGILSNPSGDIFDIANAGGGGSNPITFTTQSVERMRIDSAGNVGIGTSSPTEKLDVVGNIAITGAGNLSLQRPLIPSSLDSGTPQLNFKFYSTGTTYTTGASIAALSAAAWSSTSAPTNLVFYTCPSGSITATERMRIDSAGNVGIGVQPTPSYANSKNVELAFALLTSDSQNGAAYLSCGAYESGNNIWTYKNTSLYALRYTQNIVNGTHSWSTAPTGTAGNLITFTQVMTLEANGNLTVGGTTAGANHRLEVTGSQKYLAITTNTAGVNPSQATGIFFGWNKSAGDGESNLVYGTGAGTTPRLQFASWDGVTYTERASINSSGGLKTQNTIGVGNATPSTSGAGITFPATQSASTNANTLDDYEEGTWTPVVIGTTTAGTGTYTLQSGTYTKVGRAVTITCMLGWSAHTGTGNMLITGLPFSSAATLENTFSTLHSNLVYTKTAVTTLMGASSTQVQIVEMSSGTGASLVAMDTDVAEYLFTGTYQV